MANKKMKWLITIAFATVFIALSMIGGTWKVGLAQALATVPTVPVAEAIVYVEPVYVNQPDLLVTFTGNSFIDATYTKVKWEGPDGTVLFLDPVYVNAAGTELRVMVPHSAMLKPGIAKLCVVNHPDEGMTEVSQIYEMQILGRLFLPIINGR